MGGTTQTVDKNQVANSLVNSSGSERRVGKGARIAPCPRVSLSA